MRNHSVRLFGLAAAALVLATGSAAAQGKGHGNGKGHDNGKAQDDGRGYEQENGKPGKAHGKKWKHGNVVVAPGNVIVRDGNRVYGNGRKVPPGLAKKPGQMPPGQYKKRYGTQQGASVLGTIFGQNGYTVQRIVPNGDAQWVYYRLPDGSVQRAIVAPGTERLQFTNVPAAILSAVLAKLY